MYRRALSQNPLLELIKPLAVPVVLSPSTPGSPHYHQTGFVPRWSVRIGESRKNCQNQIIARDDSAPGPSQAIMLGAEV